jgi:hypothetical protein
MIRKFAAFEVLEATLAPENDPMGLQRYAHRHSFTYDPRPGYLYIRSRAISSRTNDNFDTFPAEEIEKSYMSFVGKPVFVNHNNDNHRRARGVIIDAALHRDRNPDGSPDTWAEVLMEVDAIRFPKLATAIIDGHIDRTSMGTDVAFSKCSFCGNKATTPLEYCQHIPKLKGKRIYRTTASGKKEGVLVSEICYGLKFFENSLLVEEPADPTAFFTGVEGHGVKTASLQTEAMPGKFPTEHEPRAVTDGKGNYSPGCSCGYVGETTGNDHILAHLQSVLHANQVAWSRGLETGAVGTPYEDEAKKQPKKDDNQKGYTLSGEPSNWALAAKTARPAKPAGDESTPTKGVETDSCAQCGKPIYHVENSASGGWQHDIDGAAGLPHQAFPASGKKAAYLQAEATERKKVGEMSPSELKAFRRHQDSGRRWNRQNPAHADNIIAHWNAATDQEKHAGMTWYHDAHHLTKHIAADTGHPMHVAAGVMSTYSPQTHWATNMLNAAKALRLKKGIGGSGSGVFATHDQARRANRLMGAEDHTQEHYDKVLDGPKTHAFAHLIEHGGNKDPNNPKVVVDRHALSVACGKRAKDIDYEMSGLGGKKRYKQVADEYHKAAQHISKHTGVKVEAHQVQAATWLVRQRLNAGEDKKMASYGKLAEDAKHSWNEYAGEHHPMAMGKEPGTGYSMPKDAPEDVQHSQDLLDEGGHGSLRSAVPPTNPRRKVRDFGRTASIYLAYGETMAPADVDTLRDEECPVCGESDAYDGNRCDVCGFDAPPKMFQDPDLDMAKQLDLRKDIMQDGASDPNGDGMPDVIPGHGGMGDESSPPLAGTVPDPDDVAQQQMNQIGEDQAPLQPEQLDENGQPVAPANPLAQDMPQDPNALPMDPNDIAGQVPEDTAGQVEPGTPGDAASDLMCPVCGYQQSAAPPQSVDMDSPAESVAGAAGSLCPNCQQGQLVPIKEIDQMGAQMGQPPVPVQAAASLAFPIITL